MIASSQRLFPPLHEPAAASVATCSVCGCSIAGYHLECATCESPYHADCADFIMTCATFGCASETFRRAAAGAATAPVLVVDPDSLPVPAEPRAAGVMGPVAGMRRALRHMGQDAEVSLGLIALSLVGTLAARSGDVAHWTVPMFDLIFQQTMVLRLMLARRTGKDSSLGKSLSQALTHFPRVVGAAIHAGVPTLAPIAIWVAICLGLSLGILPSLALGGLTLLTCYWFLLRYSFVLLLAAFDPIEEPAGPFVRNRELVPGHRPGILLSVVVTTAIMKTPDLVLWLLGGTVGQAGMAVHLLSREILGLWSMFYWVDLFLDLRAKKSAPVALAAGHPAAISGV